MSAQWLSHAELLATPAIDCQWDYLSMGFSRQEYWSGLPFPSPGELPDPRTEPSSPALASGTTSEDLVQITLPVPKRPGHPFLTLSCYMGLFAAPWTHQTASSLRAFALAVPLSRHAFPPPGRPLISFWPNGSAFSGLCMK